MNTGFRGTFVISWSQTQVDGLEAAPMQSLTVGAAWSWRGDALRVDGPQTVLRLDRADGAEAIRRKAARMVERLVGAALERPSLDTDQEDRAGLLDSSFVVTDGVRSYTVTVIHVGGGTRPLLMFVDDIPPRDRELWVVHHSLGSLLGDHGATASGGVICFTPGTSVATPEGPRRVEDLRAGDRVQTKDSGAQEVLWVGQRHMTGARLHVMPHLRPVRVHASALGDGHPDQDLLVSPEHRILVEGAVAQSLFNTPEVLVAAKDLVDGRAVTRDMQVRHVTYIHLLLPQHQIIWANGVETESFHPANTALSTLSADDRARLQRLFPDLEHDPHLYGAYARRNLNESEAAILQHAA